MDLNLTNTLRDEELAKRGLPEVAYIDNSRATSAGAAPVLAVKRGEAGLRPVSTALTADDLNIATGVTPAQREAMHIGATQGWNAPGAHPAMLAGLNSAA